MTLQIGVLTVRGIDYHPTKRLAEAAAARNAEVVPINPYQVMPSYANGSAALHGHPDATYLKAVLPRQGAEIKTACLPLIAHYEQMGVHVINGLDAIQMARNKFFMLQAMTRADLPVPDTIFATAIQGCRQARQHFAPHPAVLKPISGRQGTGLYCLAPEAKTPPEIEAQLNSGRGVLVQAFIPPQERIDYRVLVIGDQVAAAMTLKPPEGDFRSNAHIGGQAAAVDVTTEMAEMAVRAAKAMKLKIAGIDFMGVNHDMPMVVEANSAPGFRALEESTGKDIAALMIDYVLKVCTG